MLQLWIFWYICWNQRKRKTHLRGIDYWQPRYSSRWAFIEFKKTVSLVFPYKSFVLYCFLRALQQNRAQLRLLYLLSTVYCIPTFLAQNCGKRVCSEAALFHVSQNWFNQEFKTELVFNIHLGDLIHKHLHIVTLRCSTEQKCYNLEINKMFIEIIKNNSNKGKVHIDSSYNCNGGQCHFAAATCMYTPGICEAYCTYIIVFQMWVDKQLHFFFLPWLLSWLPVWLFLSNILVGKCMYMYLHWFQYSTSLRITWNLHAWLKSYGSIIPEATLLNLIYWQWVDSNSRCSLFSSRLT